MSDRPPSEDIDQTRLSPASFYPDYPSAVAALRDHNTWAANVTHQTYHRDHQEGWRECKKALCREAQRIDADTFRVNAATTWGSE